MLVQIEIKESFLDKKLIHFQKQIKKQYNELSEPINKLIKEFTKDNTLKDGFFVSSEDKNSISKFNKIKDLFIRWNDKTRRIFGKLHKLETTEDYMGTISQKIILAHKNYLKNKIDNTKMEELKEQFNQICSYKNKTGEEYKSYQNPDFCSYIISQTFKKTYNDMTEFLSTAGTLINLNVILYIKYNFKNFKNKPKINVGSIGGGSGNDALALCLYLRNNRHLNLPIDVEIMDFSYSAWKKSNQKILSDIYSKSPNNFDFDWSFGDFKKDMGSFSGN